MRSLQASKVLAGALHRAHIGAESELGTERCGCGLLEAVRY